MLCNYRSVFLGTISLHAMTIVHAPRKQDDYIPLCGAWSSTNPPAMSVIGGLVNCPDCRTIINHIRANFISHGYRYVPSR